jgi:phosphinothricin acetyltransferase
MIIRSAVLEDLPQLTELHNHYVKNTHITFDTQPFTADQRLGWYHDHSDGRRHRIVVAQEDGDKILGYASAGSFRKKQAYDTTVEVSVACIPELKGKGIGTALYAELFRLLAGEDVHRAVAGIAQPNDASNALHKKFGFTPVGTFTQVGRKFDKYWDVMWLEKTISRHV